MLTLIKEIGEEALREERKKRKVIRNQENEIEAEL
jgi:hypothetical protein